MPSAVQDNGRVCSEAVEVEQQLCDFTCDGEAVHRSSEGAVAVSCRVTNPEVRVGQSGKATEVSD